MIYRHVQADLRRILAIPRKEDASEDWRLWTALLRTDPTAPALLPVQGEFLTELSRAPEGAGVFAQIGVGGGKTLILLLAAHVLQCERPLAIVPPGLEREFKREVEKWAQWYRLRVPEVVSYAALSSPRNSHLFDELRPDFVMCDECQNLANPAAARSQRFYRYGAENPRVRWAMLSGTVGNGHVETYIPLQFVALGANSPGPTNPKSVPVFSSVINADSVATAAQREVMAPLQSWAGKLDFEEAWADRWQTAPGVVTSNDVNVDTPLELVIIRPKVPPVLKAALKTLKDSWELPNGTELVDALEYARHAATLSLGVYAYRETPPSEEWMEARRVWQRELRILKTYRSRKGFDSPARIVKVLKRDRPAVYQTALTAMDAWEEANACGTNQELAEAVDWEWVDDTFLRGVVDRWCEENPRGIIWWSNPIVGAKLKEWGIATLGAGEDLPPVMPDVLALSIRRFSTGYNLQMYDTMLVLQPPSSGTAWEQMIARAHRMGQMSDKVVVTVLQSTRAQTKSLAQATAAAGRMGRQHNQPQRLQIATRS